MDKLLRLIEKDCRYTSEQLAAMTGMTEPEFEDNIKEYEKNGTVLVYKALVDCDKTDREYVSALIELQISPQEGRGYEHVAQKIYGYPEVESLYLMSGSFDLAVMIERKTMREVAFFAAEKLATIDGVLSMSTHFVLRKYKDKGIVFGSVPTDERGNMN